MMMRESARVAAALVSKRCRRVAHVLSAIAPSLGVEHARPAATMSSGSAPSPEDVARLTQDFEELFDSKPCMPIMLRLAWHDAGTYDKATRTGGANGSIRFAVELAHGANAGLKWAVDQLEPIKARHPEIGYADLYQFAGVRAIARCHGPAIPFRFGRRDAVSAAECPEEGRLPDAKLGAQHLRDVFFRMGFDDIGIVALSGGHSIGRAHRERSGFEGAWTSAAYLFDNSYYQLLLEADHPDLLKLPTDRCLVEDASFRALVETYAFNQARFFEDYVTSHVKLSELGQFR